MLHKNKVCIIVMGFKMINLFVLVDFAGDYTAYKCRQELKNIQAKCKTEESRGAAFQDLCFKFRPVMRHFFYEKLCFAGSSP